jgi:hypothetical protein
MLGEFAFLSKLSKRANINLIVYRFILYFFLTCDRPCQLKRVPSIESNLKNDVPKFSYSEVGIILNGASLKISAIRSTGFIIVPSIRKIYSSLEVIRFSMVTY